MIRSLLLLLCCLSPLTAQNAGTLVRARHGMVVSASDEATRVGRDVLRAGGNAVDAAVAVGFALAVTYPSAGNLGGGAYIVLRMADGTTAAIDARETAPSSATREMYLDAQGRVIPDRSLRGPAAAGVPGTVDGLLAALDRFGSMSRERVLSPAVRLARRGFPLAPHMARFLEAQRPYFDTVATSRAVFYKPDGSAHRAGERWRQPDLADALERIARFGRSGFYEGRTADLVVRSMQGTGGRITHADLKQYRCIFREPVRGTYRGYDILSMPPSSAGGVALIEMLNILQGWDIRSMGAGTPSAVHRMVEAMKRAFADRSAYLGDPAFTDIPVGRLLDTAYARRLRDRILETHATPGADIAPGLDAAPEGMHTTHYSILDRWGNAAAVTTTLNSVCGGKYVVGGAGFLLNNEMDDFSIKPGIPNQFGLTGGEANSIAPGKRMLSSMTPTIVLKDGAPFLLLGSPGGSIIITTVLQVLMNVVDHGMDIREAIAAGRFHHQWKPDTILVEQHALPPDCLSALESMGHVWKSSPALGRVDGILYDRPRNRYSGCSDPRGHGSARGY